MSVRLAASLALATLLGLIGLCYWPGLSGPWLFDDFSNIRGNVFLRVQSLDWTSLRSAASSLAAGPLGRPVAYISFAVNHYFSGYEYPFAYKLTNVGIHSLNTLLIAAFLAQVLNQLSELGVLSRRAAATLALAVTALWALHPIQVTSVLYVVQRMTSLSATFMLAALLCWLRARDGLANAPNSHVPVEAGIARNLISGKQPLLREDSASPEKPRTFLTAAAWTAGGVLFAVLGALTKETAVLLPLYALALDRVLYPQAWYWRQWHRLATGVRFGILAGLLALIIGFAAWHYAPGYGNRPFTLTERALTEARVVWFYVGLVFLPRINAFGLHHDDIALSTSLFTPWTTLPALCGLAGLGLLAFRMLDRRPLIGLGLVWFLAGHVLESTVVPLEIAHEHRNYLPSLGLLLAAAGALLPLAERLGRRGSVTVLTVIGTIFAATTALRADQWGDELGMSRYEVLHHPRSAQARNNLAADLVWRGDYATAREHLTAALRLAPQEVGYRMNLVGIYHLQRQPLPTDLEQAITDGLRRPISAFGEVTLKRFSECLNHGCAYMAADVETWLRAYLDSGRPTFDRSYGNFLLGLAYRTQGKTQDALNAFERAFAQDPGFLHPLFEQAYIFLALGQRDNAAFDLDRIRAANAKAWVKRDKEIAQLEAAIAQGRTTDQARSPLPPQPAATVPAYPASPPPVLRGTP